ncbi:MAG: hypothetical protein GX967_03380 [Clostridiales bacterium]|nr:hypothetical protein [Clostridiales bacterium]
MNTALSRVRSNKAFKYYKFKNKRNSKSWIVALVLNLLGLPMMYIAQNIFYSKKLTTVIDAGKMFEQYQINVSIFIGIGMFCIAISAIAGIFIVFSSFDYMYNKSLVDMAYSAPLSGTTRYTADFLSGLTIYLSPYLIGGIIGFIFGGITNLRIEEEFRVIPDLSTILPIFLGVGVAMLMAYALTTFVSVCCGSLIEAVTYTLILNAIIPIAILVTVFGAMNNIYGILQDEIAFNLTAVTSPMGVLMGTIQSSIDGYMDGTENFIYNARHLLPILLITAAAIVGAFLLNKRRKAEDCGKPFVFKVLYYILISVVTYCIITAHFATTITKVSIASAIIISAVIYFILEVITNRGFKRFWVSAIRYVATALVIMITVGPFVKTDAFGLFYRVPDINSVRSVELTYRYYDMYNQYYDNDIAIEVMFKDKDKIADIIEFHEKTLKNYKSEKITQNSKEDIYDFFQENYIFGNTDISYKMKNGTRIRRSYNTDNNEYEIIKHLEDTDEFKDATIKMIEKRLTRAGKISLIDAINEEQITYLDPVMSEQENLDLLSEAIAKDIRAGVKIFNQDLSVKKLGRLEVLRSEEDLSVIWGIDITEDHINTISFLTQKGYSSFFSVGKERFPRADVGLYNLYLIKTDEFIGNSVYDEYKEYSVNDLYYSHITSFEPEQMESARGLVVNDKVRELASNLEEFRGKSLPKYLVKFGSKLFSVPGEFDSLADEVFNSDVAIEVENFYEMMLEESDEVIAEFIKEVTK